MIFITQWTNPCHKGYRPPVRWSILLWCSALIHPIHLLHKLGFAWFSMQPCARSSQQSKHYLWHSFHMRVYNTYNKSSIFQNSLLNCWVKDPHASFYSMRPTHRCRLSKFWETSCWRDLSMDQGCNGNKGRNVQATMKTIGMLWPEFCAMWTAWVVKAETGTVMIEASCWLTDLSPENFTF